MRPFQRHGREGLAATHYHEPRADIAEVAVANRSKIADVSLDFGTFTIAFLLLCVSM